MNDSSIRRKKLFLNTSSSIISQVATIICGFVLPRLILNHFGSEVNGLVNSITQFLSIIAFLELGIGSVLQFSLYKPLAEKNEEEISKVLVSGQKFFTKIALILLVYVLFLMGVYPLIANQNFGFVYVYYSENVPLFRRNGYRKSGTMILRVRSRDTALK